MAKVRMRLDVLVWRRGLAESRERAQAQVMAGQVYVGGRQVEKPGTAVPEDANIEVRGPAQPYASRGGVKLAAALDRFTIDPGGWAVADIGASTGGFTDCWLKHGAARVWAVDVGHGQMLPRLTQDPRVFLHEHLNARELTLADVGGVPVDGASVDVSFIGLDRILPPVAATVKMGGTVIALAKPQFEVGPRRVGKGGVVRDPAAHVDVLIRLADAVPRWGLGLWGLMPSPIRGSSGNREFLLWLIRGEPSRAISVREVVAEAWLQGEGNTS